MCLFVNICLFVYQPCKCNLYPVHLHPTERVRQRNISIAISFNFIKFIYTVFDIGNCWNRKNSWLQQSFIFSGIYLFSIFTGYWLNLVEREKRILISMIINSHPFIVTKSTLQVCGGNERHRITNCLLHDLLLWAQVPLLMERQSSNTNQLWWRHCSHSPNWLPS